MKEIIALLALIIASASVMAVPPIENCDELNSIHREQLDVMEESYWIARNKGWGEHLAAIAWHESHGGLYTVNMEYKDSSMTTNKETGPSFGAHHVLVKNVLAIEELKDTPWNRSIVAAKLIHDPSYSGRMGTRILEHGYKLRGTEWGMLAYYNAGRHGGDSYAGMVWQTVQTLKACKFGEFLESEIR